MTFHATVVQVLIASPGDTQNERAAILSEASRWNGRHASGRGFVISPWLYELHSTPILGDRPQAVINRQGVDKSDVVVAVFGARIGSDTGVDVSGTAEEISRAREKGVPVHVFFSDADLPRDVDPDQLVKLQKFRSDLQDQGLYATFDNPRDLARQVIDALEYDMDAFAALPAPTPPSGVRLAVSHDHQREATKPNNQGRMQYRSIIRDLVVTNDGDATAEGLQIQVEAPDDSTLYMEEIGDDGWTPPRDLTPGSRIGFSCFPAMTNRVNADITLKWSEEGQAQVQRFTTQIT